MPIGHYIKDRSYVRDIVKRVRVSEKFEHKAKTVADEHGKPEATLYFDILDVVIDEMYDAIMAEKQVK